MRKHLLTVIFSAVLILDFGCGGNDYEDAIDVNNDFVDAMESYITDIDKADSSSDMVAALEAYAKKIEKLAPEMKAVAEKYPEWKDPAKIPEALKPIREKAEAVAAKIPATFMKTMKYMMDTEVQEAQKKLQEAMSKMQ